MVRVRWLMEMEIDKSIIQGNTTIACALVVSRDENWEWPVAGRLPIVRRDSCWNDC